MSVESAKEVFTVEIEGLTAVKERLGEEFEQAVAMIMDCPSRLVITGIGKSGIIGQKISATLNSTGTPSFFLHPVEAMHGDLGMVSSSDVILAISYSGETTELNALLSSLRSRAVRIIAMSGNPHSTLAGFADVFLNVRVPREACPLGLAPTSSTTATLVLGDALAISLLKRKEFRAEDFRRNHPGGSLGERLKVAVREVMLRGDKIPVVVENASVAEAIAELNAKSLGAVLIASADHRLRGIITDGDLRRIIIQNRDIQGLELGRVMTADPVSILGDLLAADALSIMQRHEITVLPVVGRNRKLEGILHLHDLLGKGEFRFLI
ncbi:MAG: KpsF/GutQ family sugar-phosphate isomerase [Desulfobulbaceae bacterium]|jgi:arabinose-5-phosphate isomerase|nr:KpsF/GutQ family sugar-phosphate isomerase [Desulfobulbaceae bacterium]MDY0350645.1 KpsF/GutQ family sugar-phosphate isomerase [Desulfobulbaceae bacterium]